MFFQLGIEALFTCLLFVYIDKCSRRSAHNAYCMYIDKLQHDIGLGLFESRIGLTPNRIFLVVKCIISVVCRSIGLFYFQDRSEDIVRKS